MTEVDKKKRFVELRSKDISLRKCAGNLHLSTQTLVAWNKELTHQISRLKALELEEVLETHYLTHKQRIEGLAGRIDAIVKELENRPLNKIPADRLLDLYAKYYTLLKSELIEPGPALLTDEQTATLENEARILKTFDVTKIERTGGVNGQGG